MEEKRENQGKNSLTTVKINPALNNVIISVNPDIYALDVIYSAAYVFTDRAYILLDGDPKKQIFVELRLKASGQNSAKQLEALGGEFLNELLNYSFYKKQVEKNAPLRQLLLQQALFSGESESYDPESSDVVSDIEKDSMVGFDDPDGIAVPWEEKYGKESSDSSEVVCEDCEDCLCSSEDNSAEKFDDPDGIAVPWEEKYGK